MYRKTKMLRRDFGKTNLQTSPYLFRRDATHHVVRAIQGVGQGVFIRCLVQLLNNTYMASNFKELYGIIRHFGPYLTSRPTIAMTYKHSLKT